MSRSVYFFATKRDIESLLAAVESERRLRYVGAGMSDRPDIVAAPSGLQIPNLGVAPSGDWNHEPWWLVMDPLTELEMRLVPQRGGGTRYAIDQELNAQTVVFKAGGLYGDGALIAGQVGTCSDDPASKVLVNLFTREIRRHFERVRSFFVGPEAAKMLDAGYRLTTSIDSPREYDLSRV